MLRRMAVPAIVTFAGWGTLLRSSGAGAIDNSSWQTNHPLQGIERPRWPRHNLNTEEEIVEHPHCLYAKLRAWKALLPRASCNICGSPHCCPASSPSSSAFWSSRGLAKTLIVAAIFFGAYLLVSGISQVVLAFSLHVSAGGRVLLFLSGAAALILAVLCFLQSAGIHPAAGDLDRHRLHLPWHRDSRLGDQRSNPARPGLGDLHRRDHAGGGRCHAGIAASSPSRP